MEKQSLNRFVSKYNLAGLVESVKWESKEGSLTTSFISDDKSVLGSVTMNEFENSDCDSVTFVVILSCMEESYRSVSLFWTVFGISIVSLEL